MPLKKPNSGKRQKLQKKPNPLRRICERARRCMGRKARGAKNGRKKATIENAIEARLDFVDYPEIGQRAGLLSAEKQQKIAEAYSKAEDEIRRKWSTVKAVKIRGRVERATFERITNRKLEIYRNPQIGEQLRQEMRHASSAFSGLNEQLHSKKITKGQYAEDFGSLRKRFCLEIKKILDESPAAAKTLVLRDPDELLGLEAATDAVVREIGDSAEKLYHIALKDAGLLRR